MQISIKQAFVASLVVEVKHVLCHLFLSCNLCITSPTVSNLILLIGVPLITLKNSQFCAVA